jgi:uncharacterized membrane protein
MPRNAVLALGLADRRRPQPARPAGARRSSGRWRRFGPSPMRAGSCPAVPAMVLYPVLPWIGVMALGFGMAPLFQGSRPRRLVAIGAACLGAFAVLRGLQHLRRSAAPGRRGRTRCGSVCLPRRREIPPVARLPAGDLGSR